LTVVDFLCLVNKYTITPTAKKTPTISKMMDVFILLIIKRFIII